MNKKFLSMLILAAVVFTTTACGQKKEEPEATPEEAREEVSDYSQLSMKQLEVLTYEQDGEAAYYLGLHYDYGTEDVPQNFSKAFDWYMKAIEYGEMRGNIGIGYLYLNGCGVEADLDAAADFFTAAVDADLPEGYVGLARIAMLQYEEEVGSYNLTAWDDMENALYLETNPIILPEEEDEKDKEKDEEATAPTQPEAPTVSVKDTPEYAALQEKIASAGETYGSDIYDNLKIAYDAGNLDAMFYMGYIQERGIGVERDLDAAVKKYQAVAKNTSDKIWDQYAINSAHTRLGILYMGGKWFAPDEAMALEQFQIAADNGYAMAQYYMGILYQMGLGVDRDYETALNWFELATSQDYAPAICQMGYIYFNGLGVDANYGQAAYYQKLAAAQGYVPAQINLGYMYENGYGVDQNLETALAYYKLAETSGYEGVSEAIARVELLLKDM
ncbi:MAG: SEL1-like repeat protein [Lachnospiraceae bacterium]|nr:SEL1-like repeat protein [Lachnospiraceae bacterium]